jgi:hypothetical protein
MSMESKYEAAVKKYCELAEKAMKGDAQAHFDKYVARLEARQMERELARQGTVASFDLDHYKLVHFKKVVPKITIRPGAPTKRDMQMEYAMRQRTVFGANEPEVIIKTAAHPEGIRTRLSEYHMKRLGLK